MNEFFLLIGLIILSGFFSGAEIALFSLGPEKIKALKKNVTSKKGAKVIERLERLKSDPDRLLVTILLGNNVVNVGASAIATILTSQWAMTNGMGDDTALVLGTVTGLMTFVILLFGEIFPKSIAHRHALGFALFATPILRFLEVIFFIIIAPMAKLVAKFSPQLKESGLSQDELKAAVELSQEGGNIENEERRWVQKILEFDERPVESVMTPRSKIFAISESLTLKEAIDALKDVGFSRIPVHNGDKDEILGIVSVRVLLEQCDQKGWTEKTIADLDLWEPFKIPITMKINTLLEAFRSEKTHMALVYDEHGGLVGLITLEDVLEEIFGEIEDEEDEASVQIEMVGHWTWRCSGETELKQLEEVFEKEEIDWESAPWDLEQENETVGLYILEQIEKFPDEGESIEVGTPTHQCQFIVLKLDGERIDQVEVRLKPAS